MNKTLFTFLILLSNSLWGLTHVEYSKGFFTRIHVLIVNPNEHEIVPVKAKERETVLSLASEHNALAAINGGFWKVDGTPAGALKIDNHWIGFPSKPRGAVGWSDKGRRVLFDRIMTYQKQVVSETGFTSYEEWNQLENIVGGTPLLIQNGVIIDDYIPEKVQTSFIDKRHPRTAVGLLANGDWVFVVVDGRYFGFFGGMTLNELAQFMLELHCVQAVNLDGGKSSTMVLENKVINRPVGKIREEGKTVEKVSDAILIY